MRVAVIGGRLQGVEAVYLAKKAGWHVVLIDKDPETPARGLCDHFIHLDANCTDLLIRSLKEIDFIIPALENLGVLRSLSEVAARVKIPLAFDLNAYMLSASKTLSDQLFAEINIPAPSPWPDCGFPVIVKPAGASGSEGVVRIQDPLEMELFKERLGLDAGQWVIQEYLEGPSYSIEIIGCRGMFRTFEVTELEMDGGYDCKRVLAPANLSRAHQEQFRQIALTIAGSLGLNGIMDVEVILHDNKLKVLEIDARLPSQTPAAVYHATGSNMLEALAEIFVPGARVGNQEHQEQGAVIFEHIQVSNDRLEISGEHIMGSAGLLSWHENFFGADEAITNYSPGKRHWVATLINTGCNLIQAWEKRDRVIERIKKEQNLNCYIDPSPHSA